MVIGVADAGTCSRSNSSSSVLNMSYQDASSLLSSIEQSAGKSFCNSTQTVYWYGNGFYTSMTECASCTGSATLETGSVSVPSGYAAAFGCDTITYKYCSCSLSCSSISWTACGGNSTIQYKHGAGSTGDSCSCTYNNEYRCAAGYYGSPSSCTSGCTKCPSYNGVSGTSSAGSTSVSSCCIASGTSIDFSDTKGSGTEKLTAQCCAS